MRVLVVEDEPKIAELVRDTLLDEGFEVELCGDGSEAIAALRHGGHDAVVLDVMLPGLDGLSVLRSLRMDGKTVPVLLLTAKSGIDEKVEGLDLGADDYLTKPFYTKELVARVKAITRRVHGESASLLNVAGLSANLVTRELRRDGQELVPLTEREFKLFVFLMRSPGKVFTRTEILEHVWNYDFDP